MFCFKILIPRLYQTHLLALLMVLSATSSFAQYDRAAWSWSNVVINGDADNNQQNEGIFLKVGSIDNNAWLNNPDLFIRRGLVGINGNVGINHNAPTAPFHLVSKVPSTYTWHVLSRFHFPDQPIGGTTVMEIGQGDELYNSGHLTFTYKGRNSISNYMSLGMWGRDRVLNVTGQGYVGINTTNPQTSLHVHGPIRTSWGSSDPSGDYAQLSSDWERTTLESFGDENGLLLRSNIGRKIVLDAKKVGIYTDVPEAKLHVAGGGWHDLVVGNPGDNSQQLWMGNKVDHSVIQATSHNDVYNNLTLNEAGGDVGIGLQVPNAKLHVNGNVLAAKYTNSLTVNNTLHTSSIGFDNFQGPTATGTPGTTVNHLGTETNTPVSIETNGFPRMIIDGSGNIYMGNLTMTGTALIPAYNHVANQGALLSVNGHIATRGVRVTSGGWADYVFSDTYQLPSLQAVEQHIQQHKHLPDIPSAATIEKEGVDMAPMMKLQMQKIEELTLYLIEQNKTLQRQAEQIQQQDKKIQQLQADWERLKK